jgi:excisionase family DNA binding protein
MEDKPFLTLDETAKLLNVSQPTLWRWRKRKWNPLPAIAIGKTIRFDRERLTSWVRSNERRPR